MLEILKLQDGKEKLTTSSISNPNAPNFNILPKCQIRLEQYSKFKPFLGDI